MILVSTVVMAGVMVSGLSFFRRMDAVIADRV